MVPTVEKYGVIAFMNTSAAVTMKKELAGCGLIVHMMPTPRELTASCGLSLRFTPTDCAAVHRAARAADVPVEHYSFYLMDVTPSGGRTVTPLSDASEK